MKLDIAVSICQDQTGKEASRKSLENCLNHFKKKFVADIFNNPLDYKQTHSFSLSHHQDYGVCLMAKSEKIKLGVDIEPKNRSIKNLIINRIRSNIDTVSHLQNIEFWCAKEASFKANYPNSSHYLKDISLTNQNMAIFNNLKNSFSFYQYQELLICMATPYKCFFNIQLI